MNSKSLSELSLPIHGMSCTNCAGHVEKAIGKLPGVAQVKVDIKSDIANITFDSKLVDIFEFQHAVEQAGYSVPTTEILLNVQGMTCVSCSSHVGSALGDLVGVVSANVNLDKGTAQVTYVPGLVTLTEMQQAVAKAGYQAGIAVSPTQSNARVIAPLENKGEQAADGKFTWRFKSLLRRS
ncbi:MAG: heavy-metal-associated domain-containing protein [Bellilinea sp.]